MSRVVPCKGAVYGCCYFLFLPFLITVFFQSPSNLTPVKPGHLYTQSYVCISKTGNLCGPAKAKNVGTTFGNLAKSRGDFPVPK